jgi:mono/diheme cytochrome c family protein
LGHRIGRAARPRLAALALLVGTLAPGPARGAAEPAPGAPAEGSVLFGGRCAACHGVDGRGAPGRETLQIELPDFTDCRFASREPDADWLAVIHQGGPVRGLSPLMPAHGAILSEAEIAAILSHLRAFCADPRWPRGELNLPRPLVTEKAFPEDEAVLTTFVNANRNGAVATELLFEKRLGARSMVEISLPVEAREEPGPGDSWNAGIGDVAVGAKHAFFHRHAWGSIASLGGEARLPSGDEGDGLGTGTVLFEPYLAVGQILPLDAFLQLQALGEIPADRDLADEAQLRAALGASFASGRFGRVISPMLELIATWVFQGGVDASFELVPQVQVPLSRRQHVRLDLGARVPIRDSGRLPTRVGVYLLWDWFDGGLLEGW